MWVAVCRFRPLRQAHLLEVWSVSMSLESGCQRCGNLLSWGHTGAAECWALGDEWVLLLFEDKRHEATTQRRGSKRFNNCYGWKCRSLQNNNHVDSVGTVCALRSRCRLHNDNSSALTCVLKLFIRASTWFNVPSLPKKRWTSCLAGKTEWGHFWHHVASSCSDQL